MKISRRGISLNDYWNRVGDASYSILVALGREQSEKSTETRAELLIYPL